MISSIVYGPVPSRRLGRSMGINNIPPKRCSYSCVYCQLGKTINKDIKRCALYRPQDIVKSVNEKVKNNRDAGESIDYLAFVPDGEPTLDINIGTEIELLKPLGIKIAVITNSSLLWDEEVRRDLLKADWVSLKVDAVTQDIWHDINKPHTHLNLNTILNGILLFVKSFHGELTTETMLIENTNDNNREITRIAGFLADLKPDKAYLAIPTRPTTEQVKPASRQYLNQALKIFRDKLGRVECLFKYEGNDFTSSGDIIDDLLSITAVHPMREEAVKELLNRLGSGWETVQRLIDDKKLVELGYQGKKYYMRKDIRM